MFKYTYKSVRKLICSDCGKYLSVTPIKVNKKGLPLCGRCETNESDDISLPLTDIVKSVVFPCSNCLHGCTEKVNWENAFQHENSCRYSENEDKTISSLQFDKIDGINCYNCKHLLNVPPIHLTSSKKLNCGRCPPIHIQEVEDSPSRQVFLEESLNQLQFPCKFRNQGCTKLLLWNQVELHEIICKWRNFACLSLPHGECEWCGPVANFGNHFQEMHPDIMMASPSVELDLHVENELNKLFSHENEMFLLSMKVSLKERIIWACIRYLGDSRLARNFQYRIVFTDRNNSGEFASKKREVGGNVVLDLVKAESVFNKIDSILLELNNPRKVLCLVEISKSRESAKLVNCKLEVCVHIGLQSEIEEHEKACPFALDICRWPNCGIYIPLSELEAHVNNCDKRRVPCGWSGCFEEVLQAEISKHHEICSHRDDRMRQCYINDCNFKTTVNNLLQHLREEHPEDLLTEENCTRTTINNSNRDYFHIKCQFGVFFCCLYFTENVKFYFEYLGKDEEAKKFNAILNFSRDGNNYSQIIYKCQAMNVFCDFHTVDVNLENFVQNNGLTYTVTISKK